MGRFHSHKSWTTPSNDCQASYELARQWIFTCERTHTQCNALRRTQTPQKLPTRLLDLGNDRSYLKPRLCITKGLPPDTTYMTLSHCWGGQTPLQLRKDNIESFKEGIQITQVPKSFRDAMKVAAKLKIRYLWIDSLCIVQDSTEDWQHEAGLMTDVYTNSWVNIAATKALDARDGCFAERTLLDISQCVIEAKWNSHPSQTYVCWNPEIWDYAVSHQKLLQRAWVTQEMALSPRVLHFSEHQMFWECLELRACETFPLRILRNTSTKLSTHPYSLRHNLFNYDDPMRQRLALWGRFLQEYTTCNLTFPKKDKLVAISGLARKLGSGDEYCAGLWRQDLAGQLLWSVVRIRRVFTKAPARDPRAPSWSWASVHKPVYEGRWSMDPNVNTLIKIVSIDLELENQDPFGQVRAGRLQIEGPLIKTTLRRCTRNDQDEYRWKHWLGDGLASIKADVENLEEGREVRCLPIHWASGEYPEVYGLLVEPTHKKKGEHRRIGSFIVTPFCWEGQNVDKFLAWRQFQLPATEWEECLRQNSEDKAYEYRFSLV